MRNKLKKTHKTARDYKARKLVVFSGFLTAISLCVFLPLANEYSKQNVALNQQIEVLLNTEENSKAEVRKIDHTKFIKSHYITYEK